MTVPSKFTVNIKEILEQQVHVDAVSVEDALRIVEERWKDGCYILDTDHFVGVEFSEIKDHHKHWIPKNFPLPLSDGSITKYQCPYCFTHWDAQTNFCPYCGKDL